MFTIAVNGAYPRFPDATHPQLLKQALRQYQQHRLTDRELERALERARVDAAAEMLAAGVEVISDCRIHSKPDWSWVFERLAGFELPSPENDDGCCPQLPRAQDRIAWRRPLIELEYRFLEERSPVQIRPALPGPMSLARACDPGIYEKDRFQLMKDLAQALHRELEGLMNAGAKQILIEEPRLIEFKTSPEVFLETSAILTEDIHTIITLGTWGGDVVGMEQILLESPFSGFAFDLCKGPENERILSRKDFWGERIIQLGVVDSTNEGVESPLAIADQLIKYAAYHDPGLIWVAPSAGLENFSRATAFLKLQNLSQGVELARRELARREGLSEWEYPHSG